jgi:DNA (cytosine-5)-methyltransferase 1
MTITATDLFAGPGGWDVAARDLGIEVVGLELDPNACATRRAAGLRTVEGSVLDYAPRHFLADGLIASPPCQTFSTAGLGAGRRALDDVLAAVKQLEADAGHAMPEHIDEKTAFVVEPLRWTLDAMDDGEPYRWLAFEQVPTVLPVWQAVGEVLERAGYSVAVGKLHAEQYGVPQTRSRAVLMARLDGEARLPEPTHSHYYPHAPAKLDEGVARWVTIAEALGWPEATGLAVRSNYGTGGDPAARGERSADAPAAVVTSKVGRNRWILNAAGATGLAPREVDEPSATITGKGTAAWVLRASNQEHAARRPGDAPAPTLLFGSRSNKVEWMPSEIANDVSASGRRVTVDEAAILQTFPPGYPWQGNLGKRYEQVGNAVPPLLARAVLEAVIS